MSSPAHSGLRASVPPREAGGRRKRDGLVVQAEVHDRHQLELRFNHPLDDSDAWRLDIDAYFFVPRNVGLNPGNYSREQFYADFTALMRIDAQPIPLEVLADEGDPSSPLSHFVKALERVRLDARPPPMAPVSVQIRLFANLFATGVRDEFRRLERALDRRVARKRGRSSRPAPRLASHETGAETFASSFESDLSAALSRARAALWAFRRVRARWWPFERLCPQHLADVMRASDEYMSLVLEERLAQLSQAVGADPRRLDGSGFVPTVRARIAALAAEESEYRARYGYLVLDLETVEQPVDPSLRAQGVVGAGEYFTYRASLLKKHVHQALYLDVRGSRGDTYIRNAVSAVGAALAAIWALAAQVPTQIAGLPTRTQFALFAGAVFAYVMKDRIKANTSEFLLKRARTFDHVSWVRGGTLQELGIGELKVKVSEAVRFVSAEALEPSVRATRSQRRTVQHAGAAQEEVIHYRKRIASAGREGAAAAPEGYRLRDLLRINIRHFLIRLDDPEDRVDFFDPKLNTFRAATLPKVYHVNLVVRLRRTVGAELRERMVHLRIVLNKDRIVRCDEIRPRAGRRGAGQRGALESTGAAASADGDAPTEG